MPTMIVCVKKPCLNLTSSDMKSTTRGAKVSLRFSCGSSAANHIHSISSTRLLLAVIKMKNKARSRQRQQMQKRWARTTLKDSLIYPLWRWICRNWSRRRTQNTCAKSTLRGPNLLSLCVSSTRRFQGMKTLWRLLTLPEWMNFSRPRSSSWGKTSSRQEKIDYFRRLRNRFSSTRSVSMSRTKTS